MQRSVLFPLLLAGLIFVPQALAQDDDFNSKVAGTWLGTGWFAFDGDCDGYPDNPDPETWTNFDVDIQSFGAGGLYVSANPANPNTGQGTWKQTGSRELTTNNITFLAAGGLVARIPGIFTFDKKFQTASSHFGAIAYAPGVDPIDGTPLFCTVGQHTLLRKVAVD